MSGRMLYQRSGMSLSFSRIFLTMAPILLSRVERFAPRLQRVKARGTWVLLADGQRAMYLAASTSQIITRVALALIVLTALVGFSIWRRRRCSPSPQIGEEIF